MLQGQACILDTIIVLLLPPDNTEFRDRVITAFPELFYPKEEEYVDI